MFSFLKKKRKIVVWAWLAASSTPITDDKPDIKVVVCSFIYEKSVESNENDDDVLYY
jgi:hypothetical protein